jgi:integrase
MARPRRDGLPPKPTSKLKFTDAAVRSLKPQGERFYLVWDAKLPGLALAVHPTGRKVWKCIYSFHGKPRWLTLGKAELVNVEKARKLAAEILLKVTTGIDIQAERQASRGTGTFEELATRYREEHAKKKNKSWQQPDSWVQKNLIPHWGKLRAADITRSDVKLVLAKIKSPSIATNTKLAASAIFNWCIDEEIGGVKANPCRRLETEEPESRERVLSDSEIPRFWAAFDEAGYLHGLALKMILLTGQRPGEVLRLHRKNIEDGWWTLPGKPVPELSWLGTKNAATHRVWLPKPAQAIVNDLDSDGLLFTGARNEDTLRDAKPAMPEELLNRSDDNWNLLFAIADLCDGVEGYGERARAAALEIEGKADSRTLKTRLLADVKAIYDEKAKERTSGLFSETIVSELNKDEEKPWQTLSRGKELNQNRLADMLADFGIRSGTIRIGDQTKKGYYRWQFDEAWERYL